MPAQNSIMEAIGNENNTESLNGLEAFFESESDLFSGLDLEETTTIAETVEVVETTSAPAPASQTQEAETALQLFRSLKDPALAPHVIAFLNQGAVPKKGEDAYNPIMEIKNAFPEGYENIAETLSPALLKVVDRLVEERIAPVRQSADDLTYQRNAEIVTNEYKSFAKTELGVEAIPANFEKELQTLVKHFPYSGEGSIQSYTRNLLYMAKGKLGAPQVTKTEASVKPEAVPVPQKQGSPLSKLASAPKPSGVVPKATSQPVKITLNDAFDAALRSIK